MLLLGFTVGKTACSFFKMKQRLDEPPPGGRSWRLVQRQVVPVKSESRHDAAFVVGPW